MAENPFPFHFHDPKVRRREAIRVTAAAAVIGCAILVGFALGLRTGDRRERREASADTLQRVSPPLDTLAIDTAVTVAPPDPPAPPKGPSKRDVTLGVEYLASHNQWNREEMERLSALTGLWDAVNTYDLEEIRRLNETLDSTPLAAIAEGLAHNPKQGYYAAKGDHVITLSTYIKRLQHERP